ncbi:MAG: DUF5615 family PIN-like protein, partial [Candidatus Eremiobacterota bacterium]
MLLAKVLRQRGIDIIHVLEVGRTGRTDLEQLEFAVSEERAILTHNVRDFILLHRKFEGRTGVTAVSSFPINCPSVNCCAGHFAVSAAIRQKSCATTWYGCRITGDQAYLPLGTPTRHGP